MYIAQKLVDKGQHVRGAQLHAVDRWQPGDLLRPVVTAHALPHPCR